MDKWERTCRVRPVNFVIVSFFDKISEHNSIQKSEFMPHAWMRLFASSLIDESHKHNYTSTELTAKYNQSIVFV
jgi:hypothetical protein